MPLPTYMRPLGRSRFEVGPAPVTTFQVIDRVVTWILIFGLVLGQLGVIR